MKARVGAGAEGLAAAADDDRAQVGRLGGEALEGGGEFGDEDAVEGVAHIGPVEPDAGDRAGAFDAERLGHGRRVSCVLGRRQ